MQPVAHQVQQAQRVQCLRQRTEQAGQLAGLPTPVVAGLRERLEMLEIALQRGDRASVRSAKQAVLHHLLALTAQPTNTGKGRMAVMGLAFELAFLFTRRTCDA